ncbi:hypothetical protein R1flu_022683 [Riccia fluitans]|uniref:Uncharacterized protein n=1 Tax=Riccia fluitans TaxID=41844 RepID=A0ABD1XSW0_9MARC
MRKAYEPEHVVVPACQRQRVTNEEGHDAKQPEQANRQSTRETDESEIIIEQVETTKPNIGEMISHEKS